MSTDRSNPTTTAPLPGTGPASLAEPDWKLAYDHAWRYFALHATQRMTVFNFFVVFSGFVIAGIATTMQGSQTFSYLGCALGLILILLAFIFWKLDQRVAFLIKHAEAIQMVAEDELLPPEARLFCLEPPARKQAAAGRGWLIAPWTYGYSFRMVFTAMAIIGAGSALLSGLRATGVISWEVKPEKKPEVNVTLVAAASALPAAIPTTKTKLIPPHQH